ncbi:hypothetical protein VN0568_14590 [Helicobacter pylori]
MLFHTQNRITTTQGTNHFIPFSETEVNAKERYSSHALLDFLKGKIKEEGDSLFLNAKKENKPLEFSQSALKVFNAGKKFIAITTHKIPQTASITLTQAFMTSKNFFKAVMHKAN